MAQEEFMRPVGTSDPSKRRSHLELIAEILENARIASTRASLISKVGMSYHQFNEYSEFLNNKGLIESNEGVYQITAKGMTFVREYKTLLSVLLTADSLV
jgi:predicted transcriptional regulator